jgi:hypothetical protein
MNKEGRTKNKHCAINRQQKVNFKSRTNKNNYHATEEQ